MRSLFAKQPESLKTFMKLAEMHGVNPEFVITTLNTDIDGICANHLECEEVIVECRDNPWYYFREIAGLSNHSEIDILHMSLLLKGWTVVRHGNVAMDKSFLPTFMHYVLRFQDIKRNLGVFINDYNDQNKFIKAMESVYERCVEGADILEHGGSYATNAYTGKLCRVQPAIWALATGRYSLGVFNLGSDTPFYLEKQTAVQSDSVYDESEMAIIEMEKMLAGKLPYEGVMSYYGDKSTVDSEIFVKLLDSLNNEKREYVYDLGEAFNLLNKQPDENIICVI